VERKGRLKKRTVDRINVQGEGRDRRLLSRNRRKECRWKGEMEKKKETNIADEHEGESEAGVRARKVRVKVQKKNKPGNNNGDPLLISEGENGRQK